MKNSKHFRKLLFRVFSSLSFSLVVVAQTTAPQNCFVWQDSPIGPDFSGSWIRNSPGNYINSSTFDTYLSVRFDDNPAYVNSFRNSYGCPGWDGRGQRYHISLVVALVLTQSLSQCGRVSYVPICKQTCQQGLDAFKAIIANTTACGASPLESAANNRNTFIQVYTNLCGSLTETPNCRQGVKREVDQCGFPLTSDLQSYCSSAPGNSDECCARATSAGIFIPITDNTPGSQIVGTSPPPSGSDNVDVALMFGLIGLGVAFLVCMIIAAPFLILRRRKMSKKEKSSKKGKARALSADMSPYLKNSATPATIGTDERFSYSTAPGTILIPDTTSYVGAPSPKQSTVSYSQQSPVSNVSSAIMQSMPPVPIPPMPNPVASVNRNQTYPPQNPMENSTEIAISDVGTFDRIIGAINEGKTMKVVYEYIPRLGDELRLNFGNIVVVTEIFDDGWAAGNNLVTGQSGAFPLIAVGPIEEEIQAEGKGKDDERLSLQRVSSLTPRRST